MIRRSRDACLKRIAFSHVRSCLGHWAHNLKTLKRPERLLSLGSLDLLSIVPSLLESHEPQTQRLTVFAEDESTELTSKLSAYYGKTCLVPIVLQMASASHEQGFQDH